MTWPFRVTQWLLPLLLGIGVNPLVESSYAEDTSSDPDFRSQLSVLARSKSVPAGASDYLSALLKVWDGEQDARFKASVGLDGNSGPNHDKYTADLGLGFARGSFPRELRLESGVRLVFTDGKSTENVTRALVNYDYHPIVPLEVYGFTQLFTNEFLSIRQRVEFGVGAKWELEVRKYTSRGDKGIHDLMEANQPDEGWLAKEQSGLAKGALKSKQIMAYRNKIALPAVRKKYTRLQGGLAASVFVELEQPAAIDTLPGPGEASVTPPGSTRFRATVRPSFTLRPDRSELVTLDGGVYVKYAIDRPARTDGRLDYRIDAWSQMRIDLDGDPEKDRVDLLVQYFLAFDNIPPRVGRFVAEDTDHAVKLKLAIGL